MELGFMVEPQIGGSYADLVRLATWAEANGFASFARADHYFSSRPAPHVTDALTSLAGLARETTSIKLTVLVTPITFRHPAVIAKTAATLSEMADGRFELGVGTGWMELEHEVFGLDLPPLGERFDRFEESLGYLWSAFGRSHGGFHGEHFVLADVDVLPTVGTSVPLVIGGSGMRRTPALAGRYADEYNMFVTGQEVLGKRLAVMREAARTAQRDPDRIKVSMAVAPVVGDDRADYHARRDERAAARKMAPPDYEAMLAERHIPHGTADEVASQFTEMASWGVHRIYLQQLDPLDAIDLDGVARTAALLAGV